MIPESAVDNPRICPSNGCTQHLAMVFVLLSPTPKTHPCMQLMVSTCFNKQPQTLAVAALAQKAGLVWGLQDQT